ncbi:MAG: hypothetical protein COA74_15885 [Gammaproteobacteria bacterium]|nr:MAG: hypothetical protein COA74_15885 [Gammaproteobacteria bacterium]
MSKPSLILLATAIFYISVLHASELNNTQKIARTEYPTKTLYDLWLASTKDKAVISNFISSLPEHYIIEAIENDDKHVMVTYFALGNTETDYIMLSGGPDFYGLRFKQLGNTSLYFCRQKIPSDAMFIFGFNEFMLSDNGLEHGVVKTYRPMLNQ